MNSQKKLTRSNDQKMVAGVCGGLGQYFGIEPARFRLIFVIIALLYGAGIVAYLLLWFLIPRAPEPDDTHS